MFCGASRTTRAAPHNLHGFKRPRWGLNAVTTVVCRSGTHTLIGFDTSRDCDEASDAMQRGRLILDIVRALAATIPQMRRVLSPDR